jgi:putative transposase
MHRAIQVALRPTKHQQVALCGLLAHLCDLYNAALQERRDAWKASRKSISLYDQEKQITELRSEAPEYSRFPAFAQRDPLRRLDRAFGGFFRRAKAHQTPGFPRFRSAERYDSFSVDSQNFHVDGGILLITKLGGFRFKTQAKLRGQPKTVCIKRFGKKWRASIVCDIGPTPEKIAIRNAIGMDVGISNLTVLSDGTEIENPKWTKRYAERLAQANHALSRKVRGSRNREKCKIRLGRLHGKITGKRRAYLHEVSRGLVNRYDLIAFEDLKISQMAKGYFAKSIMDAAWRELIWQVLYKAEEAGRYAIRVDASGTSQTCSGCGQWAAKKLGERIHGCPKCGLTLTRDHNAALNILERGRHSAGLLTAGDSN